MNENPYKSPDERDVVSKAKGEPTKRVAVVGTWLIVTGMVGILGNCVMFVGLNALLPRAPQPEGMDEATSIAYQRGVDAAPFLDCCVVTIPTLAVYPLVVLAGIRMHQMRNRWLGITGAILAMLPCSAAMLIGIPAGALTLVVLLDRSVATAFDAKQRRR